MYEACGAHAVRRAPPPPLAACTQRQRQRAPACMRAWGPLGCRGRMHCTSRRARAGRSPCSHAAMQRRTRPARPAPLATCRDALGKARKAILRRADDRRRDESHHAAHYALALVGVTAGPGGAGGVGTGGGRTQLAPPRVARRGIAARAAVARAAHAVQGSSQPMLCAANDRVPMPPTPRPPTALPGSSRRC